MSKVQFSDELFCNRLEEIKEKLYRIAFIYVKNQHEASDIFNECVYKAFKYKDRLKNLDSFDFWIKRILTTTAMDHLKKRKKIVYIENYERNEEGREDKERIYEDLYDAVDRLEGKVKTVIILKYFEDMKIKEIGEVIGISESSVKNHLHKGLKKLRVTFREEE